MQEELENDCQMIHRLQPIPSVAVRANLEGYTISHTKETKDEWN